MKSKPNLTRFSDDYFHETKASILGWIKVHKRHIVTVNILFGADAHSIAYDYLKDNEAVAIYLGYMSIDNAWCIHG